MVYDDSFINLLVQGQESSPDCWLGRCWDVCISYLGFLAAVGGNKYRIRGFLFLCPSCGKPDTASMASLDLETVLCRLSCLVGLPQGSEITKD